MMLSLACDNHKLIVDRNGNINIPLHPTTPNEVVLDPPKGMCSELASSSATGAMPSSSVISMANGCRRR